MRKPVILYLIQLPPPVHGVTLINSIVYHSEYINSGIERHLLRIDFCRQIHHVNKFSVFKLIKTISVAFRLVFVLLHTKYDFVYFSFSVTGKAFWRDLLFIAVLKAFKIKLIYHLHLKGIPVHSILSIIYRWALSNADIIHLSNGLINSELWPLKLKNTDCFSVNNGVQLLEKKPLPTGKKKDINILFLSMIDESKGILVLLEAFGFLIEKKKDIFLNVIGDYAGYKIKRNVEYYLNKYCLNNNVTIVGPKFNEEKSTFFMNADIFIHPTLNDAFPLVILEAMQFSLPIISTFEGAIPEIIDHNKNGLLVEKGNSALLVETITRLIDDPQLRISLGNSAFEKYNRYYKQEIFEKNIAQVFKTVLSKQINTAL